MINLPSVPSTTRESLERLRIDELKALLAEAANELEAHINREYPTRGQYPSELRKWERDMDLVRRMRASLEKPDV